MTYAKNRHFPFYGYIMITLSPQVICLVIQRQMNIHYVTPRLAIAKVTSQQELQSLSSAAQSRHKQYFHFFNLTNARLPAERQTSYKWRGMPFSLSEALRLLTSLDAFLRINIANAAILCVVHVPAELFARLIIQAYIQLCLLSIGPSSDGQKRAVLSKLADSVTQVHPYFMREVQEIYKTVAIHSPPVKILQSLVVFPEDLFIPVVEIFSEGRYNDFEPVYSHSIEQQLAQYYLSLNRPLQTGIGKKYYDNRPETKYFSKPVVVCGDVKIAVYSYKTLKRVHEFTIGFNTLAMDALNPQKERKFLRLSHQDLYDCGKNTSQMRVQIEYSDFCEGKCRQAANCPECKDLLKKFSARYGEVQGELQRLHRVRSIEQVWTLLSL